MLNVEFPDEKTNKRKSPDEDNWQESSQRRRGKPRIVTDSQKGKSSNSNHQGGIVNGEKSNLGKAGKGSRNSRNVKRAKKRVEREDYKFKDAYTLSDELKEAERQKQAAKKTKANVSTQNRAQDVASKSKKFREPRKKQNVEKVSGTKKNPIDVRQSKNGQKKAPAMVKEKPSELAPKQKKVEKPEVVEQSSNGKECTSNSMELSSLPEPEEDTDMNSNNQRKTSKKRKQSDNNTQFKSGKKSKSSKKQMTMVSSVEYKRPATPEEKALLLAVVAEVKKMLKKKKLSKEMFKFICKHCAGNIFTRLAENARISKPKKLVRSRKEKIKALIDAECLRVAGHKSKAKS